MFKIFNKDKNPKKEALVKMMSSSDKKFVKMTAHDSKVKYSTDQDKKEKEKEEEEYCAEYECPKCGTAVMATVELDTVECPCCGAEMDKSEDSEEEEEDGEEEEDVEEDTKK